VQLRWCEYDRETEWRIGNGTINANEVSGLASETIDLIVQRLAEMSQPERIILFGSYARGEQRPGSDRDLFVILPQVENHFSEMIRLRGVLRDIRMPIDVLVYSEADVAARGSWTGTTPNEALTGGRVLYASG
jgi:predicted nucleotidyltransferase